MVQVKETLNEFVVKYDEIIDNTVIREFYGNKDFYNVGYWQPDTLTQHEACENLMEKLLEFIPENRGNILEVACGLGETTKYLQKHYEPANIVAINISPKQLEKSKVNAPGSKFIVMDAAKLDFEDDSFDHIICVEAAFHFNTREKFLREAWRILKPGGSLVLSDILFEDPDRMSDWMVPPENDVKSVDEYQNIYQQIGFDAIKIIDTTRQSWTEYFYNMRSWLKDKFQNGKIDEPTFNKFTFIADRMLDSTVKQYLLVSAIKKGGKA